MQEPLPNCVLRGHVHLRSSCKACIEEGGKCPTAAVAVVECDCTTDSFVVRDLRKRQSPPAVSCPGWPHFTTGVILHTVLTSIYSQQAVATQSDELQPKQ
jgi:hypothetical protein